MALVAGVDSSTQSCKVVVRDADDRRAGPRGPRAPTRTAPRSHPRHWWTALHEAGRGGRRARRRRGASRSAASSTAWSPSTTTGERRPARAAVERHPLGAAGGAAHRRARRGQGLGATPSGWSRSRRSPSPSSPGSPSTSRTPRPGSPAVCLPHDWLTWLLLGRRRAAGGTGGLARRLVTDRGDASGTGLLVAPPPASTGRDLLRPRSGTTPCCPGCSARPRRAGTTAAGRCCRRRRRRRPRHRRQHGGRARRRRPARAT